MQFRIHLWQLYLTLLAGWMTCEQHQIIEHLNVVNQVPREKLGKQRILLTDHQRRRLVTKVKQLGRWLLAEVTTLFTPPDTVLSWPVSPLPRPNENGPFRDPNEYRRLDEVFADWESDLE